MFQSCLDSLQASRSSFQSRAEARHRTLPPISIKKKKPKNHRFAKALHSYLNRHSYNTAVTDDLLSALNEVDPTGGQVSKSFKGWIEKPGFPVITLRETDNRFVQERFSIWHKDDQFNQSTARNAHLLQESRWMVPITYHYYFWNSTSWTQSETSFFFLHPDEHPQLPSPSIPEGYINATLIINPDRPGLYKTLYRRADYKSILGLLSLHPDALTASDRAGLYADVTSLMLSGQLDVDIAVRVLNEGLKRERHPAVWRTISMDVIASLVGPRAGLFEVDNEDSNEYNGRRGKVEQQGNGDGFFQLPAEGLVRKWLKRVVGDVLKDVGLPDVGGSFVSVGGGRGAVRVRNEFELIQLRKILVPLAGALNETAVVNWALEKFYKLTASSSSSSFLLDSTTLSSGSLESFLPTIYSVAVKNDPMTAVDILTNLNVTLPGDRWTPLAASSEIGTLKSILKKMGPLAGAQAILSGGFEIPGFASGVGIILAWESLRSSILDGVYRSRSLAETLEILVASGWKDGLIWRDALSLLGTNDWEVEPADEDRRNNFMLRFVRRGLERADAGSRFGKGFGLKLVKAIRSVL
jgi:hypothetical protein